MRRSLTIVAVLALAGCAAQPGGGSGGSDPEGVENENQISDQTFEVGLEQELEEFVVRPGEEPVRQRINTTLFERIPIDKPSEGDLVLEDDDIQVRPLDGDDTEPPTGTILLLVVLADLDSLDPFVAGTVVGSFRIRLEGGLATVENSRLPLPPEAVDRSATGSFMLGFEASSEDVDAGLTVLRTRIAFGPAEEPAPDNGGDGGGGPAAGESGGGCRPADDAAGPCDADLVCGDDGTCGAEGEGEGDGEAVCDADADECTPSGAESDTIHSSEWLAGSIDTVVDKDTYTFTGQAGDLVFIQVNRTSDGLNPSIDLFPPGGDSPEATVGSSPLDNHASALLYAHPLAVSGQYAILVRDQSGNDTGEYLVSLLSFSGALTSLEDLDGGPIAFEESQTGAIDPVVDMDAYTFTGQAGDVVFIQVNRTSGGLNPTIDLFPPGGESREVTVGSSPLDNHSSAFLYAHPLAESGQYTILVRDQSSNDAGEYIMLLSSLP